MLYQKQDLRRMLAPLVVEQVLAMLVGMVDTMMVSSSGEAAVSGVALVDMVNYLIITVMAALTTGGAVVISQYLRQRAAGAGRFFGRAAGHGLGPAVHGHHGPWPGLAAGDLAPVFRRGGTPCHGSRLDLFRHHGLFFPLFGHLQCRRRPLPGVGAHQRDHVYLPGDEPDQPGGGFISAFMCCRQGSQAWQCPRCSPGRLPPW